MYVCIYIYMGLLGICDVEACSSMLDQPHDVRTTIIQTLDKHEGARLLKQL